MGVKMHPASVRKQSRVLGLKKKKPINLSFIQSLGATIQDLLAAALIRTGLS